MRTLMIALFLAAFAVACTELDAPITALDASFNYAAGFAGVAGDAPPSQVTVDHAFAFPSTNVGNEEMTPTRWGHVVWNSDDAGIGEAPLKFISERNFFSCFEYRIDDAPAPNPNNPNTHIADGLWPSVCVNASTTPTVELDLTAISHVDVRLSLGGERDERFDWTRFYVMTITSKDECKDGGWQAAGFSNQGQCVRFVETGKDSR